MGLQNRLCYYILPYKDASLCSINVGLKHFRVEDLAKDIANHPVSGQYQQIMVDWMVDRIPDKRFCKQWQRLKLDWGVYLKLEMFKYQEAWLFSFSRIFIIYALLH